MFKDYHEYTDLLKRIDYCLNWYDHQQIYNTSYKVYLANNKSLEIKFPENSIPHLLGINVDFLRSTGCYTGGAYKILEEILANPTRLYNLIRDGHMKKENVFSKYIDKKLSSFFDNCNIKINDIEFVVDYSSSNSYITGEEKLDGDYYIGYKNKEKDNNCLTVIGFSQKGRFLYPLTNLSIDLTNVEDEQFLNRLLKNQLITIVQSVIKYGYNKYDRATSDLEHYDNDDKVEKLKNLAKYEEKYEANIATHKETLFYAEKAINLYDEKKNIWNILDYITDAIINREFINIDDLKEKYGYIKRSIFKTISAYNDLIMDQNNETNFSYQEFVTQLKNEKEKALKYEDLYKKANENNNEALEKAKLLEEENEKLLKRLNLLEEENKVLKENEEKIRKILNR